MSLYKDSRATGKKSGWSDAARASASKSRALKKAPTHSEYGIQVGKKFIPHDPVNPKGLKKCISCGLHYTKQSDKNSKRPDGGQHIHGTAR